jgi:hypothetical protein
MFMDRHPLREIDRAVQLRMYREAKARTRDASGTVPLRYWVDDGTIYCIVDAPNDDAVCAHHRERNLACDDLHVLTGLSVNDILSGTDHPVVADAIDRFWHASDRRTLGVGSSSQG